MKIKGLLVILVLLVMCRETGDFKVSPETPILRLYSISYQTWDNLEYKIKYVVATSHKNATKAMAMDEQITAMRQINMKIILGE